MSNVCPRIFSHRERGRLAQGGVSGGGSKPVELHRQRRNIENRHEYQVETHPNRMRMEQKRRCFALFSHVQTFVCDTVVRSFDLTHKISNTKCYEFHNHYQVPMKFTTNSICHTNSTQKTKTCATVHKKSKKQNTCDVHENLWRRPPIRDCSLLEHAPSCFAIGRSRVGF